MRLTVELLNRAEQRTNCLGERELVLSGLGIPAIENTASLLSNGEEFDCLDISNNLLVRLDNFSRWHRLSNLLASGNRIESIDARNFQQNVPNVRSMSLSHNNISSLAEVKALGNACKSLTFLDLTGNPVSRRPHYRLYAIHNIPSLRCLDFSKIKREERLRATRLFQSAAGAALENDVQRMVDMSSSVKTFTPGESADGLAVLTLFTAEEKEAIRNLLANAESVQEVEEIESAVGRGMLPDKLRSSGDRDLQPPASKRLKVV